MSDETGKITAYCEKHSPHVAVVVDDIDDDKSKVKCPQCGHDFGTWGDVKAQMLEAAKADLQEQLLAPFKNSKLWKVRKG